LLPDRCQPLAQSRVRVVVPAVEPVRARAGEVLFGQRHQRARQLPASPHRLHREAVSGELGAHREPPQQERHREQPFAREEPEDQQRRVPAAPGEAEPAVDTLEVGHPAEEREQSEHASQNEQHSAADVAQLEVPELVRQHGQQLLTLERIDQRIVEHDPPGADQPDNESVAVGRTPRAVDLDHPCQREPDPSGEIRHIPGQVTVDRRQPVEQRHDRQRIDPGDHQLHRGHRAERDEPPVRHAVHQRQHRRHQRPADHDPQGGSLELVDGEPGEALPVEPVVGLDPEHGDQLRRQAPDSADHPHRPDECQTGDERTPAEAADRPVERGEAEENQRPDRQRLVEPGGDPQAQSVAVVPHRLGDRLGIDLAREVARHPALVAPCEVGRLQQVDDELHPEPRSKQAGEGPAGRVPLDPETVPLHVRGRLAPPAARGESTASASDLPRRPAKL